MKLKINKDYPNKRWFIHIYIRDITFALCIASSYVDIGWYKGAWKPYDKWSFYKIIEF